MRLLCIAVGTALACSPAAATDLSGEIGLVSDYRYRGVSLSFAQPAVQGLLTLEHESGLYTEVWGSTLGNSDIANAEIDVVGGFVKELTQHLGVDFSGTYVAYPQARSDNYFEATAAATFTRGQLSGELGLGYVPEQRATDDHDNVYLFGAAELELPHLPVTLKTGLGYERGAFDGVQQGGKWDWSLSGEVDVSPARLGLAWTASNADGGDRHGLIASLFLSW